MSEKGNPKYDDFFYRYPGDFRSSEIVLYSYGGAQLEITGLTAVVNIYQDIDSAFLSGINLIASNRTHPICIK